MVICQHAKYTCSFCGKSKMKRTKMGIWNCGSDMKIMTGEAWDSTTSADIMKSNTLFIRMHSLCIQLQLWP
uniref:Ribosomal protein L37a n=1 Tax=Pseudonaja textilis TaxID=8673 RepID=A0A670XT89_PSETE